MLMLTSGSTGNAKAVVLTHRQVLASVSGKTGACALPAGRPFLNWIGLDHVGAFVEIHLHALWVNEDQIHVQAADVVSAPAYFLDLLSRHRVSRSFAPNFFLASLVSAAAAAAGVATGEAAVASTNAPSWDLSDLKFLVSGGEANDIKTCVAASALLEKYGAPRGVIAPGFGMTETCAGSIYNTRAPDYDLANGYKVASLGKCIKGMEMRVTLGLRRRDGQPESSGVDAVLAQPNQPGDLEVRGEMVFKEYYRNSAATADAFTHDGWFRTGDRAVLDSDGNLCLVGRVKEVINILGVKVPTNDLQSCLDQAIEGCHIDRLIVFPSRADTTEQVTVACREVKGHTITDGDMYEIENRLVQACMMVTASRPVIFMLGPESLRLLPTTTLGKISRAKMQSLYEDGAFNPDVKRWRSVVDDFKLHRRGDIYHGGDQDTTAAAATVEEMALIEDFKSISTNDAIGQTIFQAHTSLWELGYTSMDIVRLKHAIDARLGLFIPIIMIMKNPTARSLAAAISKLRSMKDATHSTSIVDKGEEQHSPGINGHSLGNHDSDEADRKYDPVVAFRASGTKTPLWLVHPGVGEVLVFVGLAQQLSDDDRPLYALRARGFEPGETRFGDINETVSTYVAAIRRVQPQGPYAIAGYSYGAMLAFEIAKRLDGEHGQETKFLGSFNLPPNIKMRMRQLNWNMCLLHLAYFLGLTTEDAHEILQREHHDSYRADGEDRGDGFSALGRDTALARVLGISDSQRMSELGLSEWELTRWADVAYGLQSMAIDYEPSGMVDSIHVFHAEPLKVVAASREEWLRDHLGKWADFSRSAPTFTQVGGAHYTMLGPDHVSGFAPKLKEALRDRGV
ncbi:putative NRPS-like protein biosynthetic cluster [Diaporthe australafricana]|uniref:NRPS-like protein biosynthetic cluster n=1 Tax=Diaporthe australafricana TaxID=127596 RepID=A0ABR3VYP9_9PEZI